ncbi:MAG TPA: helix-turn-helix transcriptional regulator [Baekduia sp.]|nr:helix-turn-helix transcriptional regulator [Baekduia sp.]
MDAWQETFTANVRAARERAGLTQEDVGNASGVGQAQYNRYENGRVDPSIGVLIRIAAALGVTAAELLDGVEADAPQGAR